MTITEKVNSVLETLDIPYFFITRGNNKAPCIVYNYIETPKSYSDDEENITTYTILLNLYLINNIEKNKKIVIKTMEYNGFLKTSVQSTLLDDTGFFNTPVLFKIDLRRNEING